MGAALGPGDRPMNATTCTASDFIIGHIYKGARAGTFIILAARTLCGVDGFQVKPFCPVMNKALSGEMFFSPDMLRAD